MTSLAYGKRVSEEFRRKVIGIAADGGFDPSWLMAVMAFETADTFQAHIRNPLSGATGLIQFMPSTALDMGTTVDALARKTPEEQLDDVYRYFQPYFGKIKSLSDCYMVVLWPAAVGRPDQTVLFSEEQRAYAQNRGLDLDKNGNVTKWEAAEKVRQRLEIGLRPENAFDLTQEPAPIEDRSTPARPEDVERINQPEGTTMGPLAFLLPLIQSLASVFAPFAQAKLQEALGKTVKDPVMSGQMAVQIIDIVRQAASTAGLTVPAAAHPIVPTQTTLTVEQMSEAVQAVAAVKANPTAVEATQTQIVDYLDRLMPLIDRVDKMEQSAWAASEASANAAAARHAGLPADAWDMTRTLVWGMLVMMAFLLLFVAGIAGWQTYVNNAPTTEVWAAVTGLIGFATGIAVTVFAFRFGYSRQSGAKDALLSELATRR